MPSAKVTTKGQITIPLEVRHKLGLDAGDRVQFVESETGGFEIIPATGSVAALKGIVPPLGRALTHEEMDNAIARASAETMKS
jgi:AbrB family looped-hinge helix DNA binding protein